MRTQLRVEPLSNQRFRSRPSLHRGAAPSPAGRGGEERAPAPSEPKPAGGAGTRRQSREKQAPEPGSSLDVVGAGDEDEHVPAPVT